MTITSPGAAAGRGTTAAPVTPHPMADDGTGACATCNVHDPDRRNARHQMPTAPEQAVHRARIGERDD